MDADAARPGDTQAATTTRSVCCYCGVGCGVLIESRGGVISGVRGDPAHPANSGRLCSKGSTLHLTARPGVAAQARLLTPMRRPSRGAALEALDWDGALELAAGRLHDIVQRDGPDAVGFYVSGQFLTEDYYVFNKLARALVGTPHIDSNSRLCMSSAVAGYKRTLGADAPPCSYEDIERAATVFLCGSNLAFAHPILFRRLEEAKRSRPGLRIVVVDPRRTDTAELADLHLAIEPGTDVALFHGMLHVILWDGLADLRFIGNHTDGFEALRERVREFTPRETGRICGIAPEDLVRAAHWFAQRDARSLPPADGVPPGTLSMYCQGLNQSADGTAKNAALINLHLATGQIGRAGAGPLSLTGQPNAMGGREVGAMANLLSGHRDLDDARDRAEVAALWGVDSIPAPPGLTAVEMFEAAAQGRLKALWIACTNPAQSMPDQATVRGALERAEFVVVQEAFATTATADFADLLLPAASWGEKEGTMTNSERRISRVRAAVVPPGLARADWAIGVDFARRLEARMRPGRPTLFPFDSAESIWNEHRETTRGRDLDIGGLSYPLLDREGPQQWPFPAGAATGMARLYGDARFATPDRRAHFADVAFRPVAEPRDARHPFSLITGRERDQWHGMSRTGTVAKLFGTVPEPAVELNPRDMERLGLRDGDLVHLGSRRGSIVVPAAARDSVLPMQAFLAMHWGGEYLGGRARSGRLMAGVNELTLPARCPQSAQPELKHAAVRIVPAGFPWRLVATAWLAPERVLATREVLRRCMSDFDFACCVPFGSEREGVLIRAAALEPPAPEAIDRIEMALGLAGGDELRYCDPRRGQRRILRVCRGQGSETLEGFLLAGKIDSEEWIRGLLLRSEPLPAPGHRLLSPGARPPKHARAASRQVCSCFAVDEDRIEEALSQCEGDPQQRLALVQQRLNCGTKCGSCLPELRRLARRVPSPA